MSHRLIRGLVCAAALAAAFTFASALAAAVDEPALVSGDPPGATCYHFVLITVCCGAGGCYIV